MESARSCKAGKLQRNEIWEVLPAHDCFATATTSRGILASLKANMVEDRTDSERREFTFDTHALDAHD